MKKSTGILAVVLIIAAAIYCVVYFFAIPKTAAFIMPDKWKNIAAGEKMESYYQYLGKPSHDLGSREPATKKWQASNSNFQFYLNIHFRADSIADGYKIDYSFSNWLLHKKDVLREENLQ